MSLTSYRAAPPRGNMFGLSPFGLLEAVLFGLSRFALREAVLFGLPPIGLREARLTSEDVLRPHDRD